MPEKVALDQWKRVSPYDFPIYRKAKKIFPLAPEHPSDGSFVLNATPRVMLLKKIPNCSILALVVHVACGFVTILVERSLSSSG